MFELKWTEHLVTSGKIGHFGDGGETVGFLLCLTFIVLASIRE